MNEWQSIDTAPKDGTEVLGWNTFERRVTWFHHDDFGHAGFIIGWDEIGEDWFFPTHWMPLPEPPK